MAKVSIEESTLKAIGDAIREKGGTTAGLNPEGEMPAAIRAIEGGAEVEEITNEAGGKSVYINSEVPKLPEGYTRLKYIESTGVQYINTGYTPNSNTRVVLDAYNLSASSSWAFGAWTSSSSLQFAYSCGSYGFRYGSTNATMDTAPVGSLQIDFNKNAYNRNGTTGTMSEQTFTCEYPLFLFTINAKGTASSGKFTGQVSSCQIYDNGVLVRDYVPCLNASGEAGLYDFVNGVFYGDAAGVGFIAGPVVLEYELPDGYEELEYIQSDGRQYADTGFKPNNNTRVVIDLQGATTTGGVYMHYGVPSFMAGKASSSSWNYYVYYNTQEVAYSTRTASDFTARHTIDQNKNVITTGADTRTLAVATFSSGYNMYLFGVNSNGSLAYASPIKVFSCQIYDNGTLVRYYVPCKSDTGEIGLWDVVNNTFTGDAAGVGFIAGPSTGVSKVVLEDEVLIDLTGDTVTPEALLSGFTAHNAMGQLIQGAVNSGIPCAQGSLTNQSLSQSVTVSGLSFQPKSVFLVLSMTPRDQYDVIASAYLAEGNSLVGATISRYNAYYGISIFSFAQSDYYIQTNSNGFVVRTPNGTYVSGTYRWFAVG